VEEILAHYLKFMGLNPAAARTGRDKIGKIKSDYCRRVIYRHERHNYLHKGMNIN
jgi:hypothetical protein